MPPTRQTLLAQLTALRDVRDFVTKAALDTPVSSALHLRSAVTGLDHAIQQLTHAHAQLPLDNVKPWDVGDVVVVEAPDGRLHLGTVSSVPSPDMVRVCLSTGHDMVAWETVPRVRVRKATEAELRRGVAA